MKPYESKVKELLSRMTVEEKVGQLQQCGPSLVGAFEVSFEELLDMMFDGRISQEEFGRLMGAAEQDFHEEALRAGRIGSYNGISDVETANRLQKIAVEETRLGIPLLFGYDVIHGYRTVTPIPLAEACAWEPELWERTARLAAKEATAGGVNMTFAPMVDVARDARWGRISEGAGEDPALTAAYGVAKVRGFQGNDLSRPDAMAACVKHFAAYGAAEAGRDYNRVDMSLQRLYEEYLPPFEACVRAGARAVMPAFNDLNGVPCTVNGWLLRDVLRRDWGFEGVTVSDSNAIAECVNHGFSAGRAEAAAQAIEAGVDIDMSSDVYARELAALVRTGAVPMETLDRAAGEVLRLKFELGLFDNPYQSCPERAKKDILRPEYRAIAKEAADKSIVLLKNDGVLPLKRGVRVGVWGELASSRADMLGAWSVGADGGQCVSLADALAARGVEFTPLGDGDPDAGAAACDVIIAAVGEKKELSGEAASRAVIGLPDGQREALEKLNAFGRPVVAVVFGGRPLAIPCLAERVPAILMAWHPGVEAGNAIADILFGDVNPSAKLTATFPCTAGQCPMYYAHMNTGRPGGKSKFTSKYLDAPLEPLFPFGFGLSYTAYEYGDLRVKRGEDAVTACVTVKNTGGRAGEEIVQCYFRDPAARRVRPVKQLVDFVKIPLEAGEEKAVSFTIPYRKLGYYDTAMNYVVEAGEFELFVGGNSRDCLSARFVLEEGLSYENIGV